jgi:hypothetical protein
MVSCVTPSRGIRLSLVVLGIALAFGACAHAARRADPVPAPPLSSPATPPEILREVLTESSATFREVFRRLPAADVQKMVAELPAATDDEKAFKASLDGAGSGPAKEDATKKKVLELADTGATSNFGARGAEVRERRTRFLRALASPTLEKLALELVGVERERDAFCAGKRPRIHNIGLASILTFEPRPAAGDAGRTRAIRIPVDGRDLDPRCVRIGAIVTGTVPIGTWKDDAYAEYFRSDPAADRPDIFEVQILPPLVDRLKSGDQLTVQVTLSQFAKSNCEGIGDRVVAFASRTFTLYSVDDYRTKVLGARIPAHDIRAFPLPDDEIAQLFGPLIAEHFYVVRISIRNPDNETKLVSTGMITASGRALVESRSKGCEQPAYTIPVTVIPSSLQQTFKILDDEESNQPRSWVFRSLEFSGALASAAVAAFGFSLDVSKAFNLVTGIGIPEGKKLVPDRWPGYKSNVVSFAMQDLFKIPAQSVSDHKLLFFSKKNLQGIIADQNFFVDPQGKTEDLSRIRQKFGFWTRNTRIPEVHVISLAFDNLDVRFEKVFEVGRLTLRQRLASLVAAVPTRISALEAIDTGWPKGGRFDDSPLTATEWGKVDAVVKTAATPADSELVRVYQAALATLEEADRTPMESDPKLSELLTRFSALVAVFDPRSNTVGYRKDLVTSPEFGLSALRVQQAKVTEMSRTFTAGPEPDETDVAKIETMLANNRKALDFYAAAAHLLANPGLVQALGALKDAARPLPEKAQKARASGATEADRKAFTEAKDALKKAAAPARTTLDRELKSLQATRPDGALNLMSSVPWPAAR